MRRIISNHIASVWLPLVVSTLSVALLLWADRAIAGEASNCPVSASASEEELANAGREAMKLERYPEAVACFTAAYERKPDARWLYNLARSFEHQQQWVKAYDNMRAFEQSAEPTLKASIPTRELLTGYRQRVGLVWLDGLPDNAKVSVNGKPLRPLTNRKPIAVEPGPCTIVVSQAGKSTQQIKRSVSAGSEERVIVSLGPTPGAAVGPLVPIDTAAPAKPTTSPTRPVEPLAAHSSVWIATRWVSASVTAVGIAGVVVSALEGRSIVEAICGNAGRCPSSAQADSRWDSLDKWRTVNTAGWVLTAAGAAGLGVSLWQFGGSSDERSQSVRVSTGSIAFESRF